MSNPVSHDKLKMGQITYQSEMDPRFIEDVGDTAFGEQLYSCIQCGTCSAACPLSPRMDYTPRQIIAMVREGFRKEVLNSSTIWLCASCYDCTVECPREIKITDVMYALKREAILEGSYTRRFPIPVLAKKFFNQVQNKGRQNETRLIISVYLLTNPLMLLKNMKLAVKLFLRGRLAFFESGIKNKRSLRTMLHAAGNGKVEVNR